MRSNRLCLNSEKTEFHWCATSRRCPHLDTGELSVCGSLIRPVTIVRDLGVMLQSDLSMKDHVARTISGCFLQLRLLEISVEAARAAVSGFFYGCAPDCSLRFTCCLLEDVFLNEESTGQETGLNI